MLTEKNKENRKNGIGASEAGIVLGLNPYVSPYELWRIKTGRMPEKDLSDIPQVYWGTVHEENIAQHYAKVMNCRVRRATETRFHPEHKFMLCHLDRKIEGLQKALECKFAMFAKDTWGPSGSDVVPMSYIVQVQYQMAVTGYTEADLAVLISGYDFRVYHFKREEALIEKIIAAVKEFWNYVETDTPPPLRDTVDAALAYPLNDGTYKEADAEILEALREYDSVRVIEKDFKEKKDQLKDKITLFLLNADGVKSQEKVLATWKATAKGSRVLRVIGE